MRRGAGGPRGDEARRGGEFLDGGLTSLGVGVPSVDVRITS